jgi:tetratricopeptide (TPR) repeat protein
MCRDTPRHIIPFPDRLRYGLPMSVAGEGALSDGPYRIQLFLRGSSEPSERGGRYDLTLFDGEVPHVGHGYGSAFLDLEKQQIAGLDLSIEEFLDVFLQGDSGTPDDGRLFGRHLLDRLLGDGEVRAVWDAIQLRRRQRPLRMELILPSGGAEELARIPFELLADDVGFLFRRPGSALVRVLQTLPPSTHTFAEGDALLVAWANPVVVDVDRLPPELFEQHEHGTATAAQKAGFRPRGPCKNATLPALAAHLAKDGGVPIVSLVAHGDPTGGAVWLHKESHADYPNDPGVPVPADDLARAFREGKTRVALLWTCYGARQHSLGGALASALLHPEKGDLAAVVASHAALRAEDTHALAVQIFEGIRAEGDLERAVARARAVRLETDLQWAAPVYYARPRDGQSVGIAQAEEASPSTLPVSPGEVERAPMPWPHFRGRDDEIAQGLTYLRAGRLLSVIGMAGMGKTETTLAIARKAAADPVFGIARALWFRLDGQTDAGTLRVMLAFGLGAEPQRCSDDEALARHIGDAAVLLVLDNAEDPIRRDRAGVRNLVETLLSVCPRLRILLATREKIGLVRSPAEQGLPIHQLDGKVAREVFLSVSGERLSEGDRSSPDLDWILDWLGGHPLSIVLVARQTDSMSLGAIRQRLDRRGVEAVQAEELFDEEPKPNDDERLRRDRLVSSLNLSFRPLVERAPGAAEMFAWLGHFPAGLPGKFVRYVFGEDAEEHRAMLLRKCMAEEVGQEHRLVLPAPVGAYARQRGEEMLADQGRFAEVLLRSFEIIAGRSNQQYPRLRKLYHEEMSAQRAIDGANLLALLRILNRPGKRSFDGKMMALAEGVAIAAYSFAALMLQVGPSSVAIEVAEQSRIWLGSLSVCGPMAIVLTALGNLYLRSDQTDKAQAAYEQALPLFASGGEPRGFTIFSSIIGSMYELYEIFLLQGLGRLRRFKGRPDEAVLAYQQALSRLPDDADVVRGDLQKELGHVYFQTGRWQLAEIAFHDASCAYDKADSDVGRAEALWSMGELQSSRCQFKEAEKSYGEALAIYSAFGVDNGRAVVKKSLAAVYVSTQRLREADELLREAMAIQLANGDRRGQASVWRVLGLLGLKGGFFEKAEGAYVNALEIYRAIKDPKSAAVALEGLGDVALAQKNAPLAFGYYVDAVNLYQDARNFFRAAGANYLAARAALVADRPLRAAVLLCKAYTIFASLEDRSRLVDVLRFSLVAQGFQGNTVAHHTQKLGIMTLAYRPC